MTSLQDNLAYEIGTTTGTPSGSPLSDGAKLEVPGNVSLIFDAGAVVKLYGANIEAGSNAQGIDRSGGSSRSWVFPATASISLPI